MSTPFLKNPADIRCALTAAALLLALLFSDTVLNAYMAATTAHPFAAGFWPHWGWTGRPARWPGRLGDTSWQQPLPSA